MEREIPHMIPDKKMPGQKIKISESEITKQIRDYLKIRQIFHWKVMQGLGATPGIADILGIYKGKPLAIEVKTAKGKPSENQLAFLARFRTEGGIAFIARSVDDVIEGLKYEN